MSPLSSLTSWSQEHIGAVFEAKTEHECLDAIRDTFSSNIKADINGRSLTYVDIESMIRRMRQESPKGLKVHWIHAVEVPSDENNRAGFLGGVYVIKGIYRKVDGLEEPIEYTRHKTVIVKIAPQSDDIMGNRSNRKIVQLSFVAADINAKL